MRKFESFLEDDADMHGGGGVHVPTCAVELQGRQDLRGAQLDPQRRHVEAPSVNLGAHTLQEHRPGSTDQVHQGVLWGGASGRGTLSPLMLHIT